MSGTNDNSAADLEACIGECDADSQCKRGRKHFDLPPSVVSIASHSLPPSMATAIMPVARPRPSLAQV